MGGGDEESEEATHTSRDLFMGGQGHDQVDHFFFKAGDGFCCASGAARQSSGIAEGVCVAPMGAVADVSKGKLPAPEVRQRD